MWSHYADYHRGICIEYDFKEITKKYTFCPVMYTDEFQSFIKCILENVSEFNSEVVKLFLAKAKDWEYEKEWRIIDMLREDSGEKGKILKGLKPQKILMGCKISKINERKIIKVSKKLHIPVKR